MADAAIDDRAARKAVKQAAKKAKMAEEAAAAAAAAAVAEAEAAKSAATAEAAAAAEAADAKSKKRERSANRLGPRERMKEAQKAAEATKAGDASASAEHTSVKKKPKKEAPSGVDVFVANLPLDTKDERIHEVFGACGAISAVKWLEHQDSGRWKGSGFLTFATREEAAAAVALHGTDFDGRVVRVDWAAASTPSCVYVGNLPFELDVAALRAAFAECGAILGVWGEKKGKRYLKFSTKEAAEAALAKNGADFGGRAMSVQPWDIK